MTESDYAAGQLRIIRSLMERATIYRSISAPTAGVGGVLSLGGFAAALGLEQARHSPLTSAEFRIIWLVVLALTGLTNIFFLWRGSARRGEPFFSPGMRLAAASLAPAFISAGLLTIMTHRAAILAVIWILFYGIGLLSTQHFAPRSLVVLGAAFFLSGCGLLVLWGQLPAAPSALVASGMMAATFGGLHLVYALAVWARGEDGAKAVASGSGAAHV